jgi:glycosyltransferase involved in cell wall biosynthesis
MRTLEELCAMPDKEIGWCVPAVVRGLRAFSRHRPDVIFSTAPAWTSHLVAAVLATVWSRPWVADFRDPWVRSPWTRYTTPVATAVGSRLERWVIRRADAVLFTTDTARLEFSEHYGPTLASKFRTVANGCDPFDDSTAPSPPRPGEPFVLLHAGTLYGGRSPLPVLRAVARLCEEDPSVGDRLRVRFLGGGYSGDGVLRSVSDAAKLQGIIEFAPRVARRESLAQMRSAGALLILQAGLDLAIPGKLYEYFAAGRPVLALCGDGEMARLVRSNRAGLVVDPASVDDVAVAIATLMDGLGDAWSKPSPSLYDGRMRAAEMTAILEQWSGRGSVDSHAPAPGIGEA